MLLLTPFSQNPLPIKGFHDSLGGIKCWRINCIDGLVPNTLTMSSTYKIVSEQEIEHKNEYFELVLTRKDETDQRIFFYTTFPILEDAAKAIIEDKGLRASSWKVRPHAKH